MARARGSKRRVLRAALVEPFLGGSHAAFARGWIAASRHDWRLISLPAARWKWRLRFAGLVLGPKLARLRPPPDVVVATSLLDLAHLRLTAGSAGHRPFIIYLFVATRILPMDNGFADRSLIHTTRRYIIFFVNFIWGDFWGDFILIFYLKNNLLFKYF